MGWGHNCYMSPEVTYYNCDCCMYLLYIRRDKLKGVCYLVGVCTTHVGTY